MISNRQVLILCAGGLVALGTAGCTSNKSAVEPKPNCGWDTSVADGQSALNDYLSSTDAWLRAHPGETPPAPQGDFWMGDCPNDGTNIGPPLEEAGDEDH